MPRHPKSIHECLNCGNTFKGHFCNECGQKAEVERLTGRHLVHETVHSLTHYEKGFFHTVWHFIVKPGTAAINFLQGKRKEYQKPVGYILILTGIYILIHNFVIDRFDYHYSVSSTSALDVEEQSNIFLRTHFTPFMLFIMLVSAIIIYLVIARGKFNFIEVLTLCLYGGGTYFFMLTLSDLVLGVLFRVNVISTDVFLWQTILSALYNLWFSFDVFKRVPIRLFWMKMITVSLLISLVGLGIMNYLPMLLMKIF